MARSDCYLRLPEDQDDQYLFTITGFSGNDPELVGFNGNYDGYSMPIPRSASLGLRFKF